RHSDLGLLRGMPADSRRIKQHVRPLQRRKARALRIPLVPADQGSEAANAGVGRAESEVARSKVKLFVVERIVGDVHLAIEAAQGAVTVEDGRSVMVDARGSLFEQRRDQDNAAEASGSRQFFGGWARNRFGQIEQRV